MLIFGFSAQVHDAVAAMSSGSYKIQADSMNFGGAQSSSGSYAVQDTAGEVGTGDLQSANTILHAGYQQASVAVTPTPTPTPTPAVTTTQNSSSGGRLPVNVINFNAIPGSTSIFLNWNYPTGADIRSVRIVRSTTFFPTNISDGEVIFEGDAQGVIDHNVTIGTQYYYTLFAQNSLGLYSSGVLAQARIAPVGEIVVTPTTPVNPFENVPNAVNVPPAITNLTLLDFDLIQDGKKITHAGDTVVIDGNKNLTIRLAYNKVPQILKTIAISLADPEDQTKLFTFLLRVNADETAYEATIAPLTKSGQYRLNAIILDYKNQSLKKINGNLRAVAFEAVAPLLENNGTLTPWLWIILILIIAGLGGSVLFARRVRRNNNRK